MSPSVAAAAEWRTYRILVDLFLLGFAVGVTRAADLAACPVAAPRGAVLPAIIDDLQVKIVPTGLGEQSFEIAFRLLDTAPVGQTPAARQAMNMGIDRKRRKAKRLGHDHAGRFMTDTGQVF